MSTDIEKTVEEELEEMFIEEAKGAKKLDMPEEVVEKVESKMDKAKVVYAELVGKARKDVIAAFIAEVGLTKAGAATYYQKLSVKK